MNVFLATLALTSHRQLTSYQEQCEQSLKTARDSFSELGDELGDYGLDMDDLCDDQASQITCFLKGR